MDEPIPCPQCGAPAQITERFRFGSTAACPQAQTGAGCNNARPLKPDPERMGTTTTGRLLTRPGAAVSHSVMVAEPGYILWTYLGAESVFFYPPGSLEEHLVVEHGIPSVDMHWKVKGCYDHAGDHGKQGGVQLGAVGDLLAISHTHEQVA